MAEQSKIKLKKSVLIREGEIDALALDPGTDTIARFSKGMAKLVALLYRNAQRGRRGISLEDIHRQLGPSHKKLKLESVQEAVELLAKLDFLDLGRGHTWDGKKDLARKGKPAKKIRSPAKKPALPRKKTFSLPGLGKVVLLGGIAQMASMTDPAFLNNAEAGYQCATCNNYCASKGKSIWSSGAGRCSGALGQGFVAKCLCTPGAFSCTGVACT